jgi:hypothetical protein
MVHLQPFGLPFALIMQALMAVLFLCFAVFRIPFVVCRMRSGYVCKKNKKSKIRKKVNDIVFLIPETYNIRTELKQKEGVPDE